LTSSIKHLQGMRTYDYILAMKEENQFTEVDPFDELDSSSDESSDFDSPERLRPTFISKFMCRKANEVIQLLISPCIVVTFKDSQRLYFVF